MLVWLCQFRSHQGSTPDPSSWITRARNHLHSVTGRAWETSGDRGKFTLPNESLMVGLSKEILILLRPCRYGLGDVLLLQF